MPTEIRPARPDEMERNHLVISYAFAGERSPQGRRKLSHIEEIAPPPLIVVQNGEIIASLRVFPFRMFVNQSLLGMGGVSSVACLPEHRRQGHVGALLRHSLQVMRDAGQPLSTLYTPHPGLYRRYGWMVAAGNLRYSFGPKRVAPYNPAAAAGTAVRIGEEQWPTVDAVYQRFAAGRTGYVERPQRWWQEAIFRRLYDPERSPSDVVVWHDEDGEPGGYAVYRASREIPAAGPEVHSLVINEFIANTSSAYVGLLRYLLSHDLSDELVWYGPIDDPLALALDDSHIVRRAWIDDYMLRVVDIEVAINDRAPITGSPEGAFTVQISDAAAPWNQGTWRIECSGGRLRAERTEAAADMAMEASTFAALYGGRLRASEAGRSSLAEVNDARAAQLADRILASAYFPYGSDSF